VDAAYRVLGSTHPVAVILSGKAVQRTWLLVGH
jgi:hypothetical protein